MNLFCTVPYVYTLEISAACNADCIGCGNVFKHSRAYLSPQGCAAVLDRIAPYAEMFRVTGGEPTLSPEFAEVFRTVDRAGKPIVMFTNGFWEDPETVIDVLGACRNLDGILVSLHGHTPAAFRAFTRGDHFFQVLENVRRACAAGIRVNTNTILTRQNIDHLEEVLNLALQAGVQTAAFSRYYGKPVPGVTDLEPEEIRRAVLWAGEQRAAGRPVKFNNNIPLCLGGEQTQACPAGDTHCTISPTGKVRLCNHSPEEVGDLMAEPIEAIWGADAVVRWRAQAPEACEACAAYPLCRGGCRAHARANELPCDPLGGRPIRNSAPFLPLVRHSLPADARPRAVFAVHPEPFGYVLVNRSQILKVSPAAKPVLDVLFLGEETLAEVGERFGQDGLNLVGLLYDRRMLEIQ